MSVEVTLNGGDFLVHEVGDVSWGNAATAYLVAIADGTLQQDGSNFSLTAEGDFGGTSGLKVLYLKSRSANLSTTGVIRLAHTDAIGFRNFMNGGDLLLQPNGSVLSYGGRDLVDINTVQTLSSKSFDSVNIGTVLSGTWSGTQIGITKGGTGATSALAAFNALSPLTTKGDILTRDGTNNIRVPVGTEGQLLSADPAQASGVRWITASGTGTVTSVAAAQPAAGLTITGTPITTAGTLTFALANDLAAIEALNMTGLYTRIATDTWAARTITGTADRITVTNGDGVAGNPTITLPNNVINGCKNALMNGAMEVWQRNTTLAAVPTNTYVADRWVHHHAGAMVFTVSRSTDVPTFAQSGQNFNYSLKIDCTTADTSIAATDFSLLQQTIEGFIWARFHQKPVTLSFWIKATATGTYCLALRNAAVDRSFIKEFTVSSSNTWEKKVINIAASPSAGTWDLTHGAGLQVTICLVTGTTYQGTNDIWQTGNFIGTANQVNAMASTANDVFFTGLQLEDGTLTTTIFETVFFPDELARCQRYYEKSNEYPHAPGPATVGSAGWLEEYVQFGGAALTRNAVMETGFRVSKRGTPSVVQTFAFTSGTAGKVRDNVNASDVTPDVQVSENNLRLVVNQSGATTTVQFICHWTVHADF